MFQVAGVILLVCAVVVLMLCVLGPCLVQDLTNISMGSDDRAGSNIQTSLDKINEKAENSPIGEFLTGLGE